MRVGRSDSSLCSQSGESHYERKTLKVIRIKMVPNAYCFRQELDSVNTVLIDLIYLATYVQDV